MVDLRKKLPEGYFAAIVIGVGVLCALALMLIPRTVQPTETPSLVLNPLEVNEQLAKDKELADKQVDERAYAIVDRAYREYGADSVAGAMPLQEARRKERERRTAIKRLEETGDDAKSILRARAAEGVLDLITGKVGEQLTIERLGRFVHLMGQRSMVVGDKIVAPSFVIRTHFKARWNALFHLKPTDGFSEVEEQAYWGWIALNGNAIGPAGRLSALKKYRAAGGRDLPEAKATLYTLAGESMAASKIFSKLYDETGNIRIRNYRNTAISMAANDPAEVAR